MSDKRNSCVVHDSEQEIVRRASLYMSKKYSDLTIVVRCRNHRYEFPAHKDIVSAHSARFRAMIQEIESRNQQSPTGDDGTTQIELPSHCEPEVAITFLRYIYTKKFLVADWRQGLELYEIAEEFEVKELRRRCFDYLETQINLQNVCYIFSRNLDFQYACLELIQAVAMVIFYSDDFLFLPIECVEKITELQKLNVHREELVFEAIWRWAEAKCRRENCEYTDEMVAKEVAPLLKNIRFKVMKSKSEKDKIMKLVGHLCEATVNEIDNPRDLDLYSFATIKFSHALPLMDENVKFEDPSHPVTSNVLSTLTLSVSEPVFLMGFKVRFGFADDMEYWDMPFECTLRCTADRELFNSKTHSDIERMPATVCKDGSTAENVEAVVAFICPILLEPFKEYVVQLVLEDFIKNGTPVCQKPKVPARFARSPVSPFPTGIPALISFDTTVMEGFVTMYCVAC